MRADTNVKLCAFMDKIASLTTRNSVAEKKFVTHSVTDFAAYGTIIKKDMEFYWATRNAPYTRTTKIIAIKYFYCHRRQR